MKAYFDNSATTRPCPEAIDAITRTLAENWGNPSSLHYLGTAAGKVLTDARQSIASRLSCDRDEIFFTSGGTESNNLALTGAAYKMKRYGKRIVSTAIEHPSVDETLNRLSSEGFEVIKLGVDSFGRIDENELFEAVTPDTILVSVMLVNNEIGTVMPVASARKAVLRARSQALIHCDAVQAFGKMPVKPSALGVDLMSVSSHKIHGPKGTGALYIRKGVRLQPLLSGGEQEKKIRPGTEAMPAIAGFAAAADALPDINTELSSVTALRDYMVSVFKKEGGIKINSPEDALPFITNISVIGIKSEPMLNFLSSEGICVSSGSACSKGKKSRVLTEIGLDRDALESPLRISFSRYTTKEEIDFLCEKISEGKEKIRHIK